MQHNSYKSRGPVDTVDTEKDEQAGGGIINAHSEDSYFEPDRKSPLPYSLKQLRVKNFYGIKDTSIPGIPLDTQWIFLTGENGFGKTVLLQALAIGLFGDRDGNTILTGDQDYCEIGVEIHQKGKNIINILGNGSGFKQFTGFVAYGPSRLSIQTAHTQNKISEQSNTTYGLFNTDGVLLNIEYELLKWYLKKDPRFEKVKKTLLRLLPHMKDIRVNKNDEVIYIEKEKGGKGRGYAPLPFAKLAAGHKSIIAMVGDILIRFYKQPQNSNVLEPKDLGGIVIIDELDLHLHPKWQRKLPVLLSSVFPRVQFIASTHSAIPFLGAPEKSIFLKVSRGKEEGIEVEHVDIKIKNLLPNTILTSAIFDLEGDEILQENNDGIDRIRTEDTFKEIAENDEIREKLEAFEKNGTIPPAGA